jgi:NH3-dependent NAD+ synthetase
MEKIDINRYIERMDRSRANHIKEMKKIITIPSPRWLNPKFKLSLHSVELPLGFSSDIIDFVQTGLQTIRGVSKNPKARLGVLLSGGVDSSVVLQAGYNAVGRDNLVALTIDHYMIGEQERQDNKKRDNLVSRLGIEEVKQDITPLVKAELEIMISLPETRRLFEKRPELFEIYRAEAVSRARVLAMLNYCSLEDIYPIDTGNLTESALGQCTIGDSSGFLISILSPLLKGEVRKLGKDLGLGKEYYEQEKRTGEFNCVGNEQLGAEDSYLDPIVHLYLSGKNFEEIAEKTGHDENWLKNLGERIEGKARIVRATNSPIVNLEEVSIIPDFRSLWQSKIKDRNGLHYKLHQKRQTYMPRSEK